MSDAEENLEKPQETAPEATGSEAVAETPPTNQSTIESNMQPNTQPNKRLEHTEPEELAHALKQVFSGEERIDAQGHTPAKLTNQTISGVGGDTCLQSETEEAAQPEAKSGYNNPFAQFADIFYGVLIAPRQTLFILSDSSKFPPTFFNLFLTFLLVGGALAMPAGLKMGAAAHAGEGISKGLLFISGNMLNWVVLSFILYYLSIWLRGNRLTLGNAFIATGWAYLPFAFFAPIACFKSALGHNFLALACLPAVWFILLQWLAFQTSLRTTTIKMAMIAIVVPPMFCLVYLSWVGLAVFSIVAQIIAHLT